MQSHERQDPPTLQPSFPARCRRCFIDFLPLTACIIAIVGLLIWALTGCAGLFDHRTTREELRVACGDAARAYSLVIERTRAGEISDEAFWAIDDGYAGVVNTCRRVLADGAQAVPGDLARVQTWTVSTARAQ